LSTLIERFPESL